MSVTREEAGDILIRLSGVRFRDVFRVDDLAVRPGRVTILAGASGSGKTTFLRLLNRMTVPDEGKILYRGRPLEDLDPVRLRRGMVMLSQTPVLFGGTVRSELSAGREFCGQPAADDEELAAVLAEVGLQKTLDESPETFSGGEKQRLALARVLLIDSPVMLLDEPSAALDEGTEQRIFQSIHSRRQQGRTVIMASHSRAIDGFSQADVYVFEDGRLIEKERTA